MVFQMSCWMLLEICFVLLLFQGIKHFLQFYTESVLLKEYLFQGRIRENIMIGLLDTGFSNLSAYKNV